MLARAEYIGCTVLGRPKSEVMMMTLGELLSQLALHRYYQQGISFKGSVSLEDIFA